ncbi:MAG TPA: peptidoglycan-binding protein [Chthoniobacterales bacterium]|nr:peptidoglycan-binding protein [Chthoniobacterales bacterium]
MNSNRFVGRQGANWHRDWDRRHDHRFGGHRFRFIDGFWWDLDLWPYDYYAYDDYPYDYYDYPSDNYSDANYSDATVSAVQSELTRLGYYRGAIDGVYGPQTRGALARYQGRQGLPKTGSITTATLRSLRVPAGAS